jgi:septum formation protein
MAKLILASGSPRRRELMAALGLAVEVRKPDADERALPGETALQTQERITRAKAAAVAADDGDIVIACDTTVLLSGDMLNKPVNNSEAWGMLTALRNREHEVNSCVVVRHGGEARLIHDATRVGMRNYGAAEIDAYIASGDPVDKAGAYAIQHGGFAPCRHIAGCPLNVIGLPLCALRRLLPGVLPDPKPVCDAALAELGLPCTGRRCD